MYKKPKGLLKDIKQKRIKAKSSFLKKLELQQKVHSSHCAAHKGFEYDCLDCAHALEKNRNVAVLRAGYSKRRSVK